MRSRIPDDVGRDMGRLAGCFWGSLLALGVVVAGITALARSVRGWNGNDWALIGVGFGVLLLVVVLVVADSRKQRQVSARERAQRDQEIRPY